MIVLATNNMSATTIKKLLHTNLQEEIQVGKYDENNYIVFPNMLLYVFYRSYAWNIIFQSGKIPISSLAAVKR